MRIISRRKLREFWESGHAKAKGPLSAWFEEVKRAEWKSPQDIKNRYPKASIISRTRVVFDIHGNHFRLVCHVRYDKGIVYIRWIGTHREYDDIDVVSI